MLLVISSFFSAHLCLVCQSALEYKVSVLLVCQVVWFVSGVCSWLYVPVAHVITGLYFCFWLYFVQLFVFGLCIFGNFESVFFWIL